MLKYSNIKTIELEDWDNLVRETYGKPYSFQQQDGCQARGSYAISVPPEGSREEYGEGFDRDTIPDEVNAAEMGVSFKAWLDRDPNLPIEGEQYALERDLFWKRNFYPSIDVLIFDLYEKGLIEAGEYVIDIDW